MFLKKLKSKSRRKILRAHKHRKIVDELKAIVDMATQANKADVERTTDSIDNAKAEGKAQIQNQVIKALAQWTTEKKVVEIIAAAEI